MKLRLLSALLLIIGLALGLAYAWLIAPRPQPASPADVNAAYQRAWLVMAAEAYAQDGDWPRTQARLNALRDPALTQTITELFTQYAAFGPNRTARALALVADRLDARTAPMVVYLATPPTSPTPASAATRPIEPAASPTLPAATTATSVAAPPDTPTPIPTIFPTVAPRTAYQLAQRSAECTRPPDKPRLRIFVQDASGRGQPGQVVWVTWAEGTDRFVTGLQPEIDPGYGDFEMQPDQTYNVSIGRSDRVDVGELQAVPCAGNGLTSWRLVLRSTVP